MLVRVTSASNVAWLIATEPSNSGNAIKTHAIGSDRYSFLCSSLRTSATSALKRALKRRDRRRTQRTAGNRHQAERSSYAYPFTPYLDLHYWVDRLRTGQ